MDALNLFHMPRFPESWKIKKDCILVHAFPGEELFRIETDHGLHIKVTAYGHFHTSNWFVSVSDKNNEGSPAWSKTAFSLGEAIGLLNQAVYFVKEVEKSMSKKEAEKTIGVNPSFSRFSQYACAEGYEHRTFASEANMKTCAKTYGKEMNLPDGQAVFVFQVDPETLAIKGEWFRIKYAHYDAEPIVSRRPSA